jgi:hypothetical protein
VGLHRAEGPPAQVRDLLPAQVLGLADRLLERVLVEVADLDQSPALRLLVEGRAGQRRRDGEVVVVRREALRELDRLRDRLPVLPEVPDHERADRLDAGAVRRREDVLDLAQVHLLVDALVDPRAAALDAVEDQPDVRPRREVEQLLVHEPLVRPEQHAEARPPMEALAHDAPEDLLRAALRAVERVVHEVDLAQPVALDGVPELEEDPRDGLEADAPAPDRVAAERAGERAAAGGHHVQRRRDRRRVDAGVAADGRREIQRGEGDRVDVADGRARLGHDDAVAVSERDSADPGELRGGRPGSDGLEQLGRRLLPLADDQVVDRRAVLEDLAPEPGRMRSADHDRHLREGLAQGRRGVHDVPGQDRVHRDPDDVRRRRDRAPRQLRQGQLVAVGVEERHLVAMASEHRRDREEAQRRHDAQLDAGRARVRVEEEDVHGLRPLLARRSGRNRPAQCRTDASH